MAGTHMNPNPHGDIFVEDEEWERVQQYIVQNGINNSPENRVIKISRKALYTYFYDEPDINTKIFNHSFDGDGITLVDNEETIAPFSAFSSNAGNTIAAKLTEIEGYSKSEVAQVVANLLPARPRLKPGV